MRRVDALIERIIFAKDRAELVAATKALDRVLLWNHYVVPQFTYSKTRDGALGSLRAAGKAARIRLVVVPDDLVVGRRARRQDGIALVAVTRREALIVGAAALAAAGGFETHACRSTRPKRTASRRSAI